MKEKYLLDFLREYLKNGGNKIKAYMKINNIGLINLYRNKKNYERYSVKSSIVFENVKLFLNKIDFISKPRSIGIND